MCLNTKPPIHAGADLENLFERLYANVEPSIMDAKSTVPKEAKPFSGLVLNSGSIPTAINSHLLENGMHVTGFADDYEYQATTQMLRDRVRSIEQAFVALYREKFKKDPNAVRLKSLNEKFTAFINKECTIDEIRKAREAKGKKLSIKELKVILSKFTTYVETKVHVEFANAYYDHEKDIKPNDENYLSFLELLRKAEIETISAKQRKTYVNLNRETGYFTAQIPLGLDEEGKPYTSQSYKRDSDKLANYVLHVMGYRDPKTKKVVILNQSTRAANYVAIDDDISNVSMLRKTLAQVRQRHNSVRALKPYAKTFTQISLLSPIHKAAAAIDEQQGLKQTLYTYLAFLMQNQDSSSTMKLRYVVEGVNVMRKNGLSDPLKFHINTRYYNQLVTDVLDKVTPEKIYELRSLGASLLQQLMTLIQNDEKILELQKQITVSWKTVVDTVTALKSKLEEGTCSEEQLNTYLSQFEKALSLHHQYEAQLFEARKKAYFKYQSRIKLGLAKLATEIQSTEDKGVKEQLLEQYNLMRELDNFYFLHEKGLYQSRKYNYQLQACVHRLAANLDHEVGVNCNDSEDRTGIENVMVMASYQFMRQNNQGLAPNLRSDKTLATMKKIAKSHQAKDAGMNNTAENGVEGHQVSSEDVDGFVNPEAVEMAKLTKGIYDPILEHHKPWSKIKALGVLGTLKMLGSFISSKFSKAFKTTESKLSDIPVTSTKELVRASTTPVVVVNATEKAMVKSSWASKLVKQSTLAALAMVASLAVAGGQTTTNGDGFNAVKPPANQRIVEKDDLQLAVDETDDSDELGRGDGDSPPTKPSDAFSITALVTTRWLGTFSTKTNPNARPRDQGEAQVLSGEPTPEISYRARL